MKPPAEVLAYYDRFPEESRLDMGPSVLERVRTQEIFARVLPPPPARVVDVGGAAGVHAAWLAGLGYDVHLVDASPRLVDEARRRNAALERPVASLTVGDARALPQADASADAVIVMGPLYHLTSPGDRHTALGEAFRVVVPGGVVAVAAVSRYASALDGLARRLTRDPDFVAIRDRDLLDGQHRNDSNHPEYFTTAYFHRPEDLHDELTAAGFEQVLVLGVEGPAWILADFDTRWADEASRRDILETARALESAPSVQGISAHLLGTGRKPARIA